MDQKNIFPLTERDFSNVWEKKWGFGPYTLRLEAAYGFQGQIASAEAVIWLIPVTIIIIVLLSILLIVAIVLAVKKKKQSQKAPLREMPEAETQPMDDQDQE